MEQQEFHLYDMHLYRDSMQNYKVYHIPKAQLIIADVPYNLGTNAYGSNPAWYIDGDNKNFSAQVLKANMKIVGNCEYGLLFYRDKLPKFNNHGKMIFNCIEWERDNETPKVHPTQKPVQLLKKLIDIFTDEGEVVIDPCCGSATTLLAAQQMMRKSYGFEVDKNFFKDAKEKVLSTFQPDMFQQLTFDEREKKKMAFIGNATYKEASNGNQRQSTLLF